MIIHDGVFTVCGTLNAGHVCEFSKAMKNLFAAFGLIINASSVALMTGNFIMLFFVVTWRFCLKQFTELYLYTASN